jgi:hypothetical protein
LATAGWRRSTPQLLQFILYVILQLSFRLAYIENKQDEEKKAMKRKRAVDFFDRTSYDRENDGGSLKLRDEAYYGGTEGDKNEKKDKNHRNDKNNNRYVKSSKKNKNEKNEGDDKSVKNNENKRIEKKNDDDSLLNWMVKNIESTTGSFVKKNSKFKNGKKHSDERESNQNKSVDKKEYKVNHRSSLSHSHSYEQPADESNNKKSPKHTELNKSTRGMNSHYHNNTDNNNKSSPSCTSLTRKDSKDIIPQKHSKNSLTNHQRSSSDKKKEDHRHHHHHHYHGHHHGHSHSKEKVESLSKVKLRSSSDELQKRNGDVKKKKLGVNNDKEMLSETPERGKRRKEEKKKNKKKRR